MYKFNFGKKLIYIVITIPIIIETLKSYFNNHELYAWTKECHYVKKSAENFFSAL